MSAPAEQETASWPLDAIAAALDAELRPVKPGIWQADIRSKALGTSLVLQLSPAHGAVRLEPERAKRAGPWTIGSITYFGIQNVEPCPTAGEVRFCTSDMPPHELLVTHLGQFRLVGGIDAAKVKPLSAARIDDEPVTVVGRLARPEFSDAKTPFWQAGLAETIVGAERPLWHNCKCWGNLARTASQFHRGQRVKVTGKRRLEKWEKDGKTYTGSSLLLTAIEPA